MSSYLVCNKIANGIGRRRKLPVFVLLASPLLLITLIYLYFETQHLLGSDEDKLPPLDFSPLSKLIIRDDNSSSVSLECFGDKKGYIKESLEMSEEIYQASVKKRRALVKDRPEIIDPWKSHVYPKYPYDYFLATFSCPFTSQRVGKLGDGGKWVCGMELLEKKSSCVMYSFGIAREVSFEREMLERTNCELVGYDASVEKIPVSVSQTYSERVTFYKLWGGDEVSETTTTVGGAMRHNGHSKIDVLKVDIEGSEFKMLRQMIDEFGDELPFTQLLLEIHMKDFVQLYAFMDMLERAGLRPVRNELNISPLVQGYRHSALSEYSFLNVKRLC